MVCIYLGYPDKKDELQILMDRDQSNPISQVEPVIHAEELLEIQEEVDKVFIHKVVYEYIVDLVDASRKNEAIELGISPRGALALAKMAKAEAYLEGRDYVIPNDVYYVFPDVATHRIRLNSRGKLNNLTVSEVIHQILKEVKKPTPVQES